jgi:hypothetical protein
VLGAGLLIPALELPAQTPAAMPQASATPAQGMGTKPATAAPPSATPSKTRARHKKEAAPVPAVPQAPPIPQTLEQSPPTPPRITYQGGQLSIDARNATLGQVLHAVQSQTGASIEIPSSANNERVVAQLGPGQPKDVLNSLLNGSKFDYIILGVTGNPGAVQKVILTSRQNSGPNVNVAQNQPQNQEADEEAAPEEPVNEAQENPTPEQTPPPPGGFRRPAMMPGGGQPQLNQGATDNGDQSNSAKTPEQLMQELQQMQQQQQQYQQQLNPANQQGPQ